MRIVSGLAGAVSAAALAGCAAMPPPPPAVLTFAGQGCTTTPDLSLASSLTPEKERAIHIVTTQVGSATPCLHRDGRDTAYLLYALPTDYDDKTLTVGGFLEPLRILSPKVAVLDGHGETSRTFRPDEFMYRGAAYSVVFRPRPGERFVLVTIDPSRVGQSYDSIVIGVNTSATGAPVTSALAAGLVGGGQITTGSDVGMSRTFSYEGAVQIAVNDSDTNETAPLP